MGQVVGYYEDSIGKFHGFLKTGTKFTTINYPGYANTYLDDINDAGQIIGVAYQSNLGSQEFLYYGGQFFQGYTNAEINGFATSVASSSPYSYEISLIPPSWSGNEAPINPGGNYAVFADGINNSGDISGGIAGSVCPGPCGFLLPDNNSNFFIFEYPNSTTTNPTRINDLSQVVGSYIDPTSGYAHGFLVTVR